MTQFKDSNPKDIVGSGKIPQSCVSQLVAQEVGVAMFEGQLKYGRHNQRAMGARASVYYDSARRHLDKWWEGQDIDPDSGLNHIVKAITSLYVLRDAMLMGVFTDDRPPQMPDYEQFVKELDEKVASLKETYGKINPKHYTRT